MLRILGFFSLILVLHYPALRKSGLMDIVAFALLFTAAFAASIMMNQGTSLPITEFLNNLFHAAFNLLFP